MSKARLFRSALALASVTILVSAAKGQTTWYVDDDAPGDPCPGDPTCSDPLEIGTVEHPFDAIQEGIDAAVNGDEVVVADGEYTGAGNKNLDFQAKGITLRSETGNRDQCIIDCAVNGRFATFGAGDTAVVESFTIRNGNVVNANGGAARLDTGSSPSFIDCVFQNCVATAYGGALSVVNATATINGCVFQGNTASFQGGAIWAEFSSVALVDTEFNVNKAVLDGGAMWSQGGEATVSGCSFTGNSALTMSGGAMGSEGAMLTCTDSSFTANLSVFGGGGIIAIGAGPASRISGCQFTNNTVQHGSRGGGGVNSDGDIGEISNCIFQGNVASYGAGLCFCGGGVQGARRGWRTSCSSTIWPWAGPCFRGTGAVSEFWKAHRSS